MEMFLTSLKTNLQQYEAEDKAALDVLFSFTDFLQFKKSILEFKSDLLKDQASGDKIAEAPNSVNPYADISTQLDNFMKEDVSDKSKGWKLTVEMKEKNGVSFKMHQRPMAGGG